ncbi:hypothetical protein [Pseudonocardia asaccharolytica]|uniref:Uncharacterized protein n=1 Tax=Pseudonocardia asaccharolytica DSM 44247 = NBRC 16224 TaxID=1123024 RepID=A0A511CYL6_9PSEU|nr:hypothetical protein [Pseudonocardia asaccharolytica]GEL16334.1 hypothetical protein PA7_01710 [Pseudonocardia asaccharolytica DSM 44247 = NBRC 16224]
MTSGGEATYEVRIWGISKRAWKSGTTYRVRWLVAGKEWHESFTTRALAESFRADLLSLTRQGEPFDIATGQPVYRRRTEPVRISWYDHACAYVDMKWPHAAGKSQQGIADALATVTPALLTSTKSRPSATALRAVLYGWSFNARRRAAGAPDDHLVRAERWVAASTRPVADLADPAVLRPALDALALRMDGRPAAASTVSRKRAIFYNAVEYAVELGHLQGNPIASLRWKARRSPRR